MDIISVPKEKEWQLNFPDIPDVDQQQNAIAAWVAPEDSQTILQAVGGYLD